MKDDLVRTLQAYFKNRSDIAFAYLFGSAATDRSHTESDIDVAVYFTPETAALEYESEKRYPEEDMIWSELERLVGRQTDFVVLNRAPSTLFYTIMHEGLPLVIHNEALHSRLSDVISSAAEDYRDTVNEYYTIMERSQSLSSIDKEKLQRIISFIQSECADYPRFAAVTQAQYQQDRDLRRTIERWAENIVNSSTDIAKTLLASEKKPIPQTYKEIIRGLNTLPEFDISMAEKLSIFSQTRNILAHEYLDIRFVLLRRFIDESFPLYSYLIDYTKKLIERS